MPAANNISEKLMSAANGLSERTIAAFFHILDERKELANTILKNSSVIPHQAISLMDKYAQEAIKILNL
jgi:hypothetical protein